MTKPQTESQTRKLIGRRLEVLRVSMDLTTAAVEDSTGIPNWKISDLEKGRTLPNIVLAGILCAFYDAPIEFLLTGRGLTRELPLTDIDAAVLSILFTPQAMSTKVFEATKPTSVGILDVSKLVPPASEFKLRMIGASVIEIVQTTPISRTTLASKAVRISDIKGVGILKMKKIRRSNKQPRPLEFDFDELQSISVLNKDNVKTKGIRKTTTKHKTKPKAKQGALNG